MSNILQTLLTTYQQNPAAALSLLPDLFQTVEDGRVIELPCKVGDKVFVRSDTWGNTWNFVTVDYGKLLVGEIVAIVKTKKQVLMKIQVEHNVSWKRERKRYPVGALGITVFLTREAAEQALKERER